MKDKKVTCRLGISVGRLADYDEEGNPIILHVSTISEDERTIEVTDNEFELISDAYKCRENEYGGVYLNAIPGCEWLYHKTVWRPWQIVAEQYERFFSQEAIIKKHLYKIQLKDDMIVYPTAEITSLQPQQPKLDFEAIPEKTVFKNLPDGSLELVRVGRDFPSSLPTCVDILNYGGHFGVSGRFCPLPLDKVTRIGERAFVSYDYLHELNLPNCTFIGEFAFSQCSGLTSVNLPKVEIIQDGGFNECHFLMGFTYPEHIKEIGEYAFCGCMHLKHFSKKNGNTVEDVSSLSEGVKVGDDAFAHTPMAHLSNNPLMNPSEEE